MRKLPSRLFSSSDTDKLGTAKLACSFITMMTGVIQCVGMHPKSVHTCASVVHACMQTFRPHKEKQGLTVAVSPELLTKRRALMVCDLHAQQPGHQDSRSLLPPLCDLSAACEMHVEWMHSGTKLLLSRQYLQLSTAACWLLLAVGHVIRCGAGCRQAAHTQPGRAPGKQVRPNTGHA